MITDKDHLEKLIGQQLAEVLKDDCYPLKILHLMKTHQLMDLLPSMDWINFCGSLHYYTVQKTIALFTFVLDEDLVEINKLFEFCKECYIPKLSSSLEELQLLFTVFNRWIAQHQYLDGDKKKECSRHLEEILSGIPTVVPGPLSMAQVSLEVLYGLFHFMQYTHLLSIMDTDTRHEVFEKLFALTREFIKQSVESDRGYEDNDAIAELNIKIMIGDFAILLVYPEARWFQDVVSGSVWVVREILMQVLKKAPEAYDELYVKGLNSRKYLLEQGLLPEKEAATNHLISTLWEASQASQQDSSPSSTLSYRPH